MASIMSCIVEPAKAVATWIAPRICDQVTYLLCFTSIINNLKDEEKNLDEATTGLQLLTNRATDKVEDITTDVEAWLEKAKNIKAEITVILEEATRVESDCLKLGDRFSLSKRAKETTDRTTELRGGKNFNVISLPRVAATQIVPGGKTCEFESRKDIEEDIMTTLRGGDVNMIGIYGMGGLGKTTMAQKIRNRVLNENVFQEAVMIVVSQQADESKIQVEIGGSLGLHLKDDNSEARRQKLNSRLRGTKRILIVLDDVWKRLVLENLGIPCDSIQCTILLTSRNRDVISATGCSVENIFGMKFLSEKEAMFLFRERAGTCVEDVKLNPIGEEVVKECGGLPIALITVGSALKDKNDASIWRDALRQLRQSDPDIPELVAEVYNPLKLSYDLLGSKPAQSLVLLCCLFPEDTNIPLEYLTYFCMGLGIFRGMRNLKEARERMCALTEFLKERSLLLDYQKKGHVRMHDVVRDVCIFIAKQKGYIGGNDCTWISSGEEKSDLPTEVFPNLRLLLSIHDSLLEENLEFNSAFLEGIGNLNVLCIQSNMLDVLPHIAHSLKTLNTLVIDGVWLLDTISVVGELVNLQILICRDCSGIKELPPGIKGLNHLKLLDLSGCKYLQSIGRGIISSLVRLEELKMLKSFNNWEAIDREEGENAAITELEALTNLRCLEIEINDPTLAAENMQLSSKLESFHIRTPPTGSDVQRVFNLSKKVLSLRLDRQTLLGHWIEKQLLRVTEHLYFSGNNANDVDLANTRNMRSLILGKCETMKNIVPTSKVDFFPSIEHLSLFSLPKLEEIWDGPISPRSFENLKLLELSNMEALKQLLKSSSPLPGLLFNNLYCIEIDGCHGLLNLGELSIAGMDCLPKLVKLKIQKCETMERVFLWNDENEESTSNSHESRNCRTKKFPKLEELQLAYMPNLANFYQGIEGIEFPLLKKMSIERCPKMTSIISNHNSSSSDIDYDYAHIFCQPEKVSFGKLKDLILNWNPFCGHEIPFSLFNGLEVLGIYHYQGSMSLFTFSMARNLVSLRDLRMYNCNEMVKLIEDDNDKEEFVSTGGQRTVVFPNLQIVFLKFLPKLETFFKWKCDVEMPSLKEMQIIYCSSMKNFTLGTLTAPSLRAVNIDNKDFRVTADLNGALQQHLAREEEKEEEGHK